MTHRFDLETTDQLVTIFFQGLLDRSALAELEALCRTHERVAKAVRVLLRAGTTVDTDLLEKVLHFDSVTVEAESPFLSRWIERCMQERQPSGKERQ